MSLTPAAEAQTTASLAQADLAATIGWLLVDKGAGQPYSNQWHSSLFGALSAGWYWNDHLKTEVDFGAGTQATSYTSRQLLYNGLPAFANVEGRFSRRTLGIGQQYQFFRNAWFHPYVAAGVLVTWEKIEQTLHPIVVYDAPGPGRVLQPLRNVGPDTEKTASAYLGTGFKAYLTQRGFFRTDFRLGFHDGLDESLLRVGFGVDF